MPGQMTKSEVAPRRQEICAVAVKLFRERGYQATSIRDIAKALGLTAGALYAHIRGKDDVLWDIASAASERFFSMMEPIVASDRVVTQRLRDAIKGHVGVITGDLDAAAVYSTEWRHLTPARRREFVARRDRYEALWQALLREGIAEGQLGDVDVRFGVLFILSSLNWIYQWYRTDGPMTPEAVAAQMADFIFDGLRRRMS